MCPDEPIWASLVGRTVFNITDPQWGAKGDGITDDTAAVQAAINALNQQGFNNNSGGGIVFFPATLGAYRITSALITYPLVRLVGEQARGFDGSRSSRLKADAAGNYTNGGDSKPFMFKQTGTAGNNFWHGGTIEHLSLDANNAPGLGAIHLFDMGENSRLEFIEIARTGIAPRTVADAVTNATATVTSATAAFTADDVNAVVTGTNIPANTKINIVNSPTSVTISNAASGSGSGGSLTVNRPADGILCEGSAPTGLARSINGVGLPGALIRLKDLSNGSWTITSLSGDANQGGLLRISHGSAAADPVSVVVVGIKSENAGAWNQQDPVVLLDNCDMVGLDMIGGSFRSYAANDVIRIDQPVTARGGPSVSVRGLAVTDPFNTQYANIIRDTSSGQAVPADATGAHPYYNVDWNRPLIMAGGPTGAALITPRTALAQAATVTPDARAGEWQTLTVTSAAAIAIAAPSNPPSANQNAELTIEIVNSSGAAMGAITWNAAFVFPTGAWVNPASTKKRFARFEWNGANWVCTSLATADY